MEPVNRFEQPVIASTGVFECGDLGWISEGSNRNHGSILSLGDGAAKDQEQKNGGGKFDQCSCDRATFAEYASMGITKIISGAQTGADRAGLDVAILHAFPHGGWCPEGRKAEDGPIDAKYELTETPSSNYLQRTEWNVRDTDGTIVFTIAKGDHRWINANC
ncbi:MAG: putative molybdenum carrier protein [Prosthecobacter sp.]|uniref:YpsA SLOG family protein n=1 Tax=Prosthecobacter sp. TaxID=1965333 RepID=UPI00263897CE|nr:putative molybdenum carrier protein [Prosthecobacter sp.]MCF7788694.1 putative molybdenum carrier protein [Prosthecobacter sp.]